MIRIHIVTGIIIVLVMEYLRRKYIDKKVKEEVQASLMQNIGFPHELGPDCNP
tara:strand:+ start:1130 stop:1288 length:159 start_codon:yes stop_codon:yes gene_type:complete